MFSPVSGGNEGKQGREIPDDAREAFFGVNQYGEGTTGATGRKYLTQCHLRVEQRETRPRPQMAEVGTKVE